MNFPGRADDDVFHYVRYRPPSKLGPAAAALQFVGRRVAISSMSRFEAAGTGGMIAADTLVWFDIDAYGGYVDINDKDTLIEVESSYSYAVVAVDEERGQLKVTLQSQKRSQLR